MVSISEKPRPVRLPAFISKLLEINATGSTGLLEAESNGVVTLIYFVEGVPVFAEEGTLGETLGRVLLREMQLTEDEYRKVLEHMTTTPMRSEQLRFGEVAVLLGFLTEAQIQDALKMQVVAKVARCLQWRDVECTFREGRDQVQEISHHPCAVDEVVFAGVSRYYDPARCQEVWGKVADRYPELVEDADLLARSLRLGKEQRKFLDIIDGTRSMRRTIDAAPIDVVRAAQLLTTLILLDAVAVHEEALEPRSRRPPPMAMPGARPSLFPHRRQPSLPPLRPQRRVPSKPPKDNRARLQAEHHFRSGQKLLREMSWAEALQQFAHALKLDPCSEYRLYAKWAQFNAITHPGERLLGRSQLRADSIQALREDRTLAVAHYILAELALLDDDHPGAKRALALAIRFEPHNPEVLRLVERIKQ
jgi:tetratricopeptide (TPR) repeat protein